MSMPSFQMSRTGKILIGVLLAAAAIFFWVNFFVRGTPPEATQPSPAPAAEAPADVGPTPATAVENGETAAAVDVETGEAGTETGSAAAAPGVESVAVDVPQPEVSTRDLVVADLPFLITEPVAQTDDETAAEGSDATGADRPETALRATINPFAPVVRPAQAATATPAATETAAATEVEIPEAPAVETAAVPEAVTAPAPAALAPPSPQASSLPRALPNGTLPSTPGLLRTARRAEVETAPEVDVADVIDATATGVREPGATAPSLAPVQPDRLADAPGTGDLVPVERTGTAPSETVDDPLVAGVTPLSAYLRDNNVTFTGAVLGPVSVGVFRTAGRINPVVVALGSSLPDTNIVLTDLSGTQARFTQDEAQQILTLNLRR